MTEENIINKQLTRKDLKQLDKKLQMVPLTYDFSFKKVFEYNQNILKTILFEVLELEKIIDILKADENITEKQIKKIVESPKGFIYKNNYKIIEIKEGFCKLEGTIIEDSLNPYGIAHGGYIFGLADTVGGIVLATTGRLGVTTSSSIIYLRKVIGNKLIAEAKLIKLGKKLINCEVDVYDEKDNLVSKALLEYMIS